MKNKNFECGKFLEEECVKASFELSDSFFNSNLTNTSTIKNEISPFNFDKNSSKVFLTKKRKNSDLNFEIFETYSNSKNSKKNSPFLSDSKITNYFQQKKNSSSKKSSELRSSNKSVEMKSMGSSFGNYSKDNLEEENKISCAKKLIFENVPQSLNKNDFNNNFNFQYNQNKDIKFDKTLELEKNLNLNIHQKKEKLFDNEIKLKISKNETFLGNISDYIPAKNFSQIEKIFDRTKNKLSLSLSQQTLDVLNKIEANKKSKNTQSPKTLKLSLENLSSTILDKNNVKNFNLKLNSKDNSPNKNSKSSQSELVRSSQEILSNFSIKEKYEELLKRELILPCHYKNLLNKFGKLDETINYLKRKETDTSLRSIGKILNENFKIEFTQEDFEKILYVTPHFFIYKWDKNFKSKTLFDRPSNELFIDVPNDIQRRISQKYDEKTNFTQLQTFPYLPMKFEMGEEILKERVASFKKILLFMTNEHHKKILKEKRIVTKLNLFKHRTWHSEFDVHGVPQLENFRLIEKPKETH